MGLSSAMTGPELLCQSYCHVVPPLRVSDATCTQAMQFRHPHATIMGNRSTLGFSAWALSETGHLKGLVWKIPLQKVHLLLLENPLYCANAN